MKKLISKIIIFSLLCSNALANTGSDIIKLQVTESKKGEVKAKILNFDESHEFYKELKEMEIVGNKNKDTKNGVVDIDWKSVKLSDNEVTIEEPFSSKVKVKKDVKSGHEFAAQGDYSSLVSAMENLLQAKEDQKNNPDIKTNSNNNNSGFGSSSYQSNTQPLSAYDNIDSTEENTTTTVEQGEEITVTDGCLPYVDYELNTIFIQQRVIRDGEELQSCHNSSVSFALQKDYDICPDKEDGSTGAKDVYFQYYYTDDRGGNNTRYEVGQCRLDDVRSIEGDVQEITTTEGCTPQVDYELNQVYIQQRVLKNGVQTQSCHNSDTSFTLQKDYEICPDQKDLQSRTNKVFFQYYYIDTRNDNNITNNIDECQIDNNQSGPLEITKNYDNCSNFVDLTAMRIYEQFQEYYKDGDDNQVLLTDCQKDYDKSFVLTESYNNCQIKHKFDEGFSVAQKEVGYNDSQGSYIKLYDCMDDEDRKYSHNLTTDTCSNVITGNSVQIFNRKYITVDGIRSYISECTPVDGNVVIQEEICYQNQYTHDFTTKQSYLNKNYFYIDGSNQRVDVANCVQSEESFDHLEDSSVCNHEDDDNTKQTTVFSKTYIDVNGSREYIGVCEESLNKIPYVEIGYKWQNEFSSLQTNISVTNSRDNVYLGSLQGQEVAKVGGVPGETTRINRPYDINTYSTSGKCDGYSSPSYNGISIDMSLSSPSSIQMSNYVENRSAPEVCYWWCQSYPLSKAYCNNSLVRRCNGNSGDNILYYQRCTDHKCSLTKAVKFPIYRRGDDSQYVDLSTNLEVKYICGNSGALNGTEVFYGN